jgi:hypothetical protein
MQPLREPCSRIVLAGLVCAALGAACSDDHYESFGGVLDLSSIMSVNVATPISPQVGYAEGKQYEYYDLGAVKMTQNRAKMTVAVTPRIYWFFRDGQPLAQLAKGADGKPVLDAAGLAQLAEPPRNCYLLVDSGGAVNPACDASIVQHPIIDTLPGRSDYQPIFEVVRVEAPKNYQLDGIKSFKALKAAGYQLASTGVVVECPVADITTPFQPGMMPTAIPPVQVKVWFRRQITYCYLMGGADQAALALLPNTTTTPAVPSVKETMGDLTVAEALPQEGFVPTFSTVLGTMPATATVPGNLILQNAPGMPGASPVVHLNTVAVAPTYVPGTLTSAGDVASMTPKSTSNYRDISVRAAVPPCMADMDCTPIMGTCDQTVHFCTRPLIPVCQTDMDCTSIPMGGCNQAVHLCTTGGK